MATVMEPDSTVQAFANYLTEMRARNGNTVQQLLSEMSIIRDGITSNNSDLTEFKRHSSQIAQQMQAQLTDLREKLTAAFGEITALVKQKTVSDQDMMKDINSLEQNLSYKTAEVEALKRSYAATHQQLQNNLIQIQNHLSVTGSELENAKGHVDMVQTDWVQKFHDMEQALKRIESQLVTGSQENKGQVIQVDEEIQRIHESLSTVNNDFTEYKRQTNFSNTRLQQQLEQIDEAQQRKRQNQKQQPGSVKGTPSMHPMHASQINPNTGMTPSSTVRGTPIHTSITPINGQTPTNAALGTTLVRQQDNSVLTPAGRPSIGIRPLAGPRLSSVSLGFIRPGNMVLQQ
eukprot:GEMP01047372.1.p1 GENE.GEMP01047372.1~~GEMP01047372.1.p1  ORF type:complete len:346 (+),score=76.78 GEMP01047372.1:173-1210(+)